MASSFRLRKWWSCCSSAGHDERHSRAPTSDPLHLRPHTPRTRWLTLPLSPSKSCSSFSPLSPNSGSRKFCNRWRLVPGVVKQQQQQQKERWGQWWWRCGGGASVEVERRRRSSAGLRGHIRGGRGAVQCGGVLRVPRCPRRPVERFSGASTQHLAWDSAVCGGALPSSSPGMWNLLCVMWLNAFPPLSWMHACDSILSWGIEFQVPIPSR